MNVRDHVDERSADVVAKPPAFPICFAKVTANEAKSKLLTQLFRQLRIAHRTEQVSISCAQIALHQQVPRAALRSSAGWRRLAHHRPHRADAAQTLFEVSRF